MTNQERIANLQAALPTMEDRNAEFARSLLAQYAKYGRLSDKQWPWVEKLTAPRQDRAVALADTTAMKTIATMFDRAMQHLKRPALLIAADGKALRLARAGERSKYNGQIMVATPGPFETREYFGRIDQTGAFHPTQRCGDDITKALATFAANPVKAAQEYGKLTGHCCFCGKRLEDERSTNVGYGPICAKNWGLPWGGARAGGGMNPDVILADHGTLIMVRPVSKKARTWINDNVQDGLWYGGALAVEPRYVETLLGGMAADGLEIAE